MEHDVDEPEWRHWWRRGFGAALVLALVVGLFVSYRPSGFEDATQLSGGEQETEQPAPETKSEGEKDVVVKQSEASEEPTEDTLSKAEARELIDAARPPEETTVQVLDAGGGSTATSEVADVLGEIGYDVVAINASRLDYPVTSVLYTEGNDAEAEALRARDERFAEVGINERLSEGVDLHVVVGADWTD
jgi:LytR cell envelope-related transcriptional attenuator